MRVNELEVKELLIKSKLPAADYVINPYTGCPHKCIYCYAEFMKRFTGHYEDWGDFIDVKICHKKINLDKVKDKVILFGSVTDAYNRFESKYNNTRNILSQFIGSDAKIEILTKSNLVVRDIDIFKKLHNVKVGISISTLDDRIRKEIEPFASNTGERINTLKILTDAGINCYIFVAPVFPLITGFKEIINSCMDYTHEFYFESLNLKGSYFRRVFKYINKYHPDMASLYNNIYTLRNNDYWDALEKDIKCYCNNNQLNYKLFFHH